MPESSKTSNGAEGCCWFLEDLNGPPLVVRSSGLESDLGLGSFGTGSDGERPLEIGVETGERLELAGDRRLSDV